ncbi:flagellar biosynthetic protein FliO [Actinokineospora cianjurensis]|uniref:Flagellar protein n=1 Tax=Actinokineospora cianjurensis TaxID=585224 RepID=A0A421AVT1_9PSEU|nr:flagellar biosynthetic protein FliO [Actinokineospora cianjurensis]RLK53644.1 flagellar protein FliO/FliZ [Actinokineospora cianjurensis]
MAELLRVFIALLLVLGALWLAARLARRPMRNRRRGGTMDVLARTQLSRGASVTVVQVDKTALVLGVTDHQVNLLHVADAEAFALPEPGKPADPTKPGELSPVDKPAQGALAGSVLSPSTWKQALDALRERSVRK